MSYTDGLYLFVLLCILEAERGYHTLVLHVASPLLIPISEPHINIWRSFTHNNSNIITLSMSNKMQCMSISTGDRLLTFQKLLRQDYHWTVTVRPLQGCRISTTSLLMTSRLRWNLDVTSILWLPLSKRNGRTTRTPSSSTCGRYWGSQCAITCITYLMHCVVHLINSSSLVFSPKASYGRNQSPVRRPVWLWHTAF